MDPALATIAVALIGLITAIIIEQMRTRAHMKKVHEDNRSDHAFVAGRLGALVEKVDDVSLDLREVKLDVRDLKQDHRKLAEQHRELSAKFNEHEESQ